MAEMINKLELVYDTAESFDILMQNVYKLQLGKVEKVTLFVTQLEVAVNVVQQEYPMMLRASKCNNT